METLDSKLIECLSLLDDAILRRQECCKILGDGFFSLARCKYKSKVGDVGSFSFPDRISPLVHIHRPKSKDNKNDKWSVRISDCSKNGSKKSGIVDSVCGTSRRKSSNNRPSVAAISCRGETKEEWIARMCSKIPPDSDLMTEKENNITQDINSVDPRSWFDSSNYRSLSRTKSKFEVCIKETVKLANLNARILALSEEYARLCDEISLENKVEVLNISS